MFATMPESPPERMQIVGRMVGADRRAARVQRPFLGCFSESPGLGPPGGRALPNRLSVAASEAQDGLRDKKQRHEFQAFHGRCK